MKRILFLFLLQNFIVSKIYCQVFTVKDLLELSATPQKSIDRFMIKKDFQLSYNQQEKDVLALRYSFKTKFKKKHKGTERSVDMLLNDNLKNFTLRTSSLSEYLDGKKALIKDGFFYGFNKNLNKDSLILFQKKNISIEATTELKDSIKEYVFKLKEKKIPDSVVYAEDLLQFDSNEFLVSFFGEKNVKRDIYYFSKKELKKCTVLFSGTQYQAVFIWGDETTLNKLSYVLITDILPTEGGRQDVYVDENNKWKFKSGLRSGMTLRDLLRLNQMDFYIYGNKSDLAFMVTPEETGKINFKKTGIMLSCSNCYDDKIFERPEVSALDIAKANVPLRVFDIILYP